MEKTPEQLREAWIEAMQAMSINFAACLKSGKVKSCPHLLNFYDELMANWEAARSAYFGSADK